MFPDMQHFIMPLEKDLEMKQHIIFSEQINKIQNISKQDSNQNSKLIFKSNMENKPNSFLKYFIPGKG